MLKRAMLAMTTIFMIMLYGSNGGAAEEFVNPDCGPDVDMIFEDWRSWTKVNPTPLQSEGHKDEGMAPYVDVYVDNLAKATYLSASAPYPECARIVKTTYTDETAIEVEGLTIMSRCLRAMTRSTMIGGMPATIQLGLRRLAAENDHRM